MLPWMAGDYIMVHADDYILMCVERIHLHMNDKTAAQDLEIWSRAAAFISLNLTHICIGSRLAAVLPEYLFYL